MIPELKVYLSKPDGSITWNTDWISEFESPWSIFQKIQFTNLLNKQDYFHLFGTPEIKKKRTVIGTRNHNLYLMPSFDDGKFIEILGFSLKGYNADLIRNLSGFLHDGELREKRKTLAEYRYWRKCLTFCDECLSNGYHSMLHQFELFQQCPFHQTPLHDQCPQCSIKYPYELFKNQANFESALTCICGHRYKKFHANVLLGTHWKTYKSNELSDGLVIEWLSLNQLQQKAISSIYLYPYTVINETPQLLNFYLNYIKNDNTSELTPQQNYSVKISKHLKKINNIPYFVEKYSTGFQGNFEDINTVKNLITPFADQQNIVMKEFRDMKDTIFGSIAKHLRKTILSKHKSCIKRYTTVSKTIDGADIPVCPYAYAYIKWRQTIKKLEHYYDVDAKPYNRSRFSSAEVSFLGFLDQDPIFDIMEIYRIKYPLKHTNYSNIKWLISHMYSYLFIHLFKLFLTESISTLTDNKDLTLKESILAFSLPDNHSDEVQKFWDQKNLNHFLSEKEVICPYPTRRSKRRTTNEKSFHPMRIAINRADSR